jgi:hypothetical protein
MEQMHKKNSFTFFNCSVENWSLEHTGSLFNQALGQSNKVLHATNMAEVLKTSPSQIYYVT